MAYKLNDGTDISQMKCDDIEKAKAKADQAFFETSRKLSPRFPDVLTLLERRRRHQENIAARFFLWVLTPAGLITLFWSSFGWSMFGAGLVGFLVVCVVASERNHKRMGSPSGSPL